MEYICRFVIALISLTGVTYCESTLSRQIRDVGGFSSSSGDRPGVVLVFINNETDLTSTSARNPFEGDDLLDLATDLSKLDSNAVYAHFDGDNLVTSHASLFDPMDDDIPNDNWSSLLEKVGSHRIQREEAGFFPDIIVVKSFPVGTEDKLTKICQDIYGKDEKCHIIRSSPSHSSDGQRFKRQAQPTTTAPSTSTPPPMTPTQRANISLDSVAGFHLLFWTSLAIALTVWGTAYGMWHMDPGRDSIIYRMTSAQKFKKDK